MAGGLIIYWNKAVSSSTVQHIFLSKKRKRFFAFIKLVKCAALQTAVI